jgi:mannose-6-phosphate isomerase-like protein (cupin superfamily)
VGLDGSAGPVAGCVPVGACYIEPMLPRFVLTGLTLASLGLAQQQAIPKLTGVVYWPAAKLQTLAAGLKTKEHPSRAGQRAASVYEQMGSHGRYSFLDGLRDGTTVPEAHAGIDDIFIVQEGEATLLYGGKVEGVAQVATGAMHGGHLVGAESVKLSPGDMIAVPGDIPHQMLVEKGKAITFLCIKVDNR